MLGSTPLAPVHHPNENSQIVPRQELPQRMRDEQLDDRRGLIGILPMRGTGINDLGQRRIAGLGLCDRKSQGIELELFFDLPEARQWLLAGNSPKDNAESS